MAISPARLAAFEILFKIESELGFSSELLAHFENTLSEPDRGLCHELTLGTLRRQIYLDRCIDLLSNGKKLDLAVRIAIRMGLYQVLFLDRVPDYSAINESVNIVGHAKKTSAKGVVNAILRRATRGPVQLTFNDEIDRISVETSHPRWLIEKWISQFGFDETIELAGANNEKPNISFRITRRLLDRESPAAIAALSAKFKRSRFVRDCFITERVTTELLDHAAAGNIYFQDEASQMVAMAVELDASEMFLDICAAPGSKTTAIASRSADLNPRPLIVAADINGTRIRFLKGSCEEQGVGFVNCIRLDAASPLPFRDKSFGTVLIDAPCTGTGTIRHNPEIRYRLAPGDFERSASKQRATIQNTAHALASGGRMIYSTCSLEIEENENVISGFLSEVDGFRVVEPNVSERFVTPEGFARTYPARDEMDGFFICVLEKTGI